MHSFRDRLRAAEAPTELIDQLGGWSLKTVGSLMGTATLSRMDKIRTLKRKRLTSDENCFFSNIRPLQLILYFDASQALAAAFAQGLSPTKKVLHGIDVPSP